MAKYKTEPVGDATELDERLNKASEDGFELVAVVKNHATGDDLLVFKASSDEKK